MALSESFKKSIFIRVTNSNKDYITSLSKEYPEKLFLLEKYNCIISNGIIYGNIKELLEKMNSLEERLTLLENTVKQ